MQKTLISLIALGAIIVWLLNDTSSTPQITFQQYKLDYSKTYTKSGEE